MTRDAQRFTMNAQPHVSLRCSAAWRRARWLASRTALLASAGSASDERIARRMYIAALRRLVHAG